MGVLVLWLRLEVRRHRRALAVLTLLVALSAGTVLTAVTGARRTTSAVDRLLAATLPADAVVYGDTPVLDWAPVRALPEVAALATVADEAAIALDGRAQGRDALSSIPADGEILRSVERPAVLAGRLADPARTDEVVVTQEFADTDGRGVGDTVRLGLYGLPTADAAVETLAGATGPPDGPEVTARIVGVVRSLWFSDPIGGVGLVVPTAAFFERYRPHVIGTVRAAAVGPDGGADGPALVRLHRGAADLPAFRAGLAAVTGRTDLNVTSTLPKIDDAREAARFEAGFLLAFGIAALLAATVLVGSAVARYAAVAATDLETLRAAGLTPRLRVVLAAAGPTAAAAVGAVMGAAAAVPASALLPIGTAARHEPAPGPAVDGWVLGAGILVVPVLVAVAAGAAAAWRSRGARPAATRSAVVAACTRLGLPVPVVVGTRFALEGGPASAAGGSAAGPARPALLAAVGGVTGVLAAITISAGVADATANPERFGQNYDGAVFLGYGNQIILPEQGAIATVAGHPEVTGLFATRYKVGRTGDTTINVLSHEPVDGPALPLVLTTGVPPAGPDEIVLPPDTARRLGAGPGSTVRITGDRGERALFVTGIGFTIEGTGPDENADSGWVSGPGFDALFTGFEGYGLAFAARPGSDRATVAAAVAEALGALPGVGGAANAAVYPWFLPSRLGEIRAVAVLPALLAVFLAVLALGAVGHALATAVRRRGADLAALRALGMTRRQCRAVVAVQSGVLTGVGLLFGIPLGVALGRVLWRLVADTTPLLYRPPDVLGALLLIVPLALLATNLLAALPARRAARLRIAALTRVT